jgi:hypothetical protein
LYVYVDVKDDTLSEVGLPNVSDGVIVAVDLLGDNSLRTNRWGSDATKNGEGIFVANPGQRLFGYGTRVLYERYLSRVASTVKEDGSGYTVEMRIELGDNVNVQDTNIGLAIIVQDNTDKTNSIINGMVSTNTQQNRVFSYNGVLDNVKLIANSSETKDVVNDADAIGYTPSVEENDTPNDPIIPDVSDPQPQQPANEGGCSGSITTSLTVFALLVCLTCLVVYRKIKLGREGE